jgi:hypothetical protein
MCCVVLQLTYPLDTLRLRLAVDPKLRGVGGAITVLLKEGSGAAFYRGLGASMLGGCSVARGAWEQRPRASNASFAVLCGIMLRLTA